MKQLNTSQNKVVARSNTANEYIVKWCQLAAGHLYSEDTALPATTFKILGIKMILKIKLKNHNYCNSCPCTKDCIFCNLYEIMTMETDESGVYTIRPEICKKENGIV